MEKGSIEYRREQHRIWRLKNREAINAKRRTPEHHAYANAYLAKRRTEPDYVRPKSKPRTPEQLKKFNLWRNFKYRTDLEYRNRIRYQLWIRHEIKMAARPPKPILTPEQIIEKELLKKEKKRLYRLNNHDAILARERLKYTPEQRAIINESRNKLYNENPEIRKKILEKTIKWNKKKYATNPDYRKNIIEKQIAYNKAHPEIMAKNQEKTKLRYQTDEEYRKRKLKYNNDWVKKKNESRN